MKSLQNTADLETVLTRLAVLQPASNPIWGRMSANQMICHLSDSFRLGLDEKHASNARSLLPRAVMRYVALHTSLPWPRGLKTRPEMEQGAGGTPPVEFNLDRDRLVEIIRRFREHEITATHPIFGPLSRRDWLRWGYLHLDHHLRQFGV